MSQMPENVILTIAVNAFRVYTVTNDFELKNEIL